MGHQWGHDDRQRAAARGLGAARAQLGVAGERRVSDRRRMVEQLAVEVADTIATSTQTGLISSLAALDAASLRTLLDRLSAAPRATERLS